MRPELTNDGVAIQSYSDIVAELQQAYRDIYGQDIDLSSNTPDGQRIGIEAKARLDAQSYGVALYNAFDPNLAAGHALNRIIKLAGITRRPATRSTWDIEVTTDRAIDFEAGYTILDDIGQRWILTAPVSVPTGTTTVTFRAETFGAIEGFTGAELEQDTVVLGVTGLSAPSDASVGTEEETDEELRIRRNNSLQNAAYGVVGSLFAKLADLEGVTDLAVYENDTDSTDSRGIPAHGVWCVVEGGAVADIVETIVKDKTAGTPTKGDEEGEYTETLIRPDGSTFTIVHVMKFDRPEITPVYVNVTATRKDAITPIDLTLISQEIAKASFNIGDNILATELYRPGYNAGDGYILTDMEVSDDNVTFTDERLLVAPDGKFTIDAADVTVTEVIP